MDPREARFAPPAEPVARPPTSQQTPLQAFKPPQLHRANPAKADAFLLGVPFDGTSGRRPMQRHAPELLRASLSDLSNPASEAQVNLFDAGDVRVHLLDTDLLDARIQGALQAVEDQAPGTLPVLLGGEHTVSLPAVRYLSPGTIISLDAHSDLWRETNGRTIAHSTWLYHAREELDCSLVLPLLRTLRGEAEDTIEHPRTYRELPTSLPEPVYLTIDVDVFDPEHAPAVAFPEEDGPDPGTVLEMIREIASRFTLAGLDLVEVNANRIGSTARLGAASLLTALVAKGEDGPAAGDRDGRQRA